jgi:hypothetical protein
MASKNLSQSQSRQGSHSIAPCTCDSQTFGDNHSGKQKKGGTKNYIPPGALSSYAQVPPSRCAAQGSDLALTHLIRPLMEERIIHSAQEKCSQ